MGHGIPLITASHGAIGIKKGINKAFLVADNAQAFVQKIATLCGDYKKRVELSDRGYEFIKHNFSCERCFKPLTEFVLN